MIYWRCKRLKGPNAYYYYFFQFFRGKKINGSEMDKIWKQKDRLAKTCWGQNRRKERKTLLKTSEFPQLSSSYDSSCEISCFNFLKQVKGES